MLESIVNRVTWWDTHIFTAVFRLHANRNVLSACLRLISRSGNGPLYPAVALLVCLVAPAKASGFFTAACIAYGIELPLYKLIKNSVRRNRPCHALMGIQNLILPPDRFSFPSGHTAAAWVMTRLLGYFFPVLAPAASIWAGLVGFPRVYLGVHYPSDAFAGIALGLLRAIMPGIFIVLYF